MTMIYVYHGVDANKSVTEVGFERVMEDDKKWWRIRNDTVGVLTFGVDIRIYAWLGAKDIELGVAENVARAHWVKQGKMSRTDLPRVVYTQTKRGNWSSRCRKCRSAVSKALHPKHLPAFVRAAKEHECDND